jgi:hypothetical protein
MPMNVTVTELIVPRELKPPVSMDGTSERDLWLLAQGTVYHSDGRHLEKRNRPFCVTIEFARHHDSALRVNVEDKEMERVARRARRQRTALEGHIATVDFQQLVALPQGVRVYGSGERTYVTYSGTAVFSAMIRGSQEICEPSPTGGSLVQVAARADRALILSERYGSHSLEGNLPPTQRPDSSLGERYGGISLYSSSDGWLWADSGNLAWHMNGWQWELRPLPGVQDICSINSLGEGRAVAVVTVEEATPTLSREVATTTCNRLMLYDNEHFEPLPIAEECSPTGCRGLEVVDPTSFWLFNSGGRWLFHDAAGFRVAAGPAVDVIDQVCVGKGVCFVAGTSPVQNSPPTPSASATPDLPQSAINPSRTNPPEPKSEGSALRLFRVEWGNQ